MADRDDDLHTRARLEYDAKARRSCYFHVRDGFNALGFAIGSMTACERSTWYTRKLGSNEQFRVDELFVPTTMRGLGLLVESFGVESGMEGQTKENERVLGDPVPLDAFVEYPIESFYATPGQRVLLRLMNTAACGNVLVSLSLRGLYQRWIDG